MQELDLPRINKFIEPINIIELGLIQDITSPMARQARIGSDVIAEIFKIQGGQTNTVGQTEIGDTTGGDVQIEPQIYDAVGTSSASSPTRSVPP